VLPVRNATEMRLELLRRNAAEMPSTAR